jgi:hypothetical protein
MARQVFVESSYRCSAPNPASPAASQPRATLKTRNLRVGHEAYGGMRAMIATCTTAGASARTGAAWTTSAPVLSSVVLFCSFHTGLGCASIGRWSCESLEFGRRVWSRGPSFPDIREELRGDYTNAMSLCIKTGFKPLVKIKVFKRYLMTWAA